MVHTDIFVLTATAATPVADIDPSIIATLPFPQAAPHGGGTALVEPVTEVRPGYAMHFVEGDVQALRTALLDTLSLTAGVQADVDTAFPAPPISHEALHAVLQGDILRFSVCQDAVSLQVTLTPFNDADGRLAGVVLMSQPCEETSEAVSDTGAAPAGMAPVPGGQTFILQPGESTSERLRRELLAVVSHELRSPLSSIQSWTHVLRQSLQTSCLPPAALPQADRALAGITAGVERQVEMVDTLIDAARVLAGDVRLRHATFRLGDVVETTLRALAPELAKKRLTIERLVTLPSVGAPGATVAALADFTALDHAGQAGDAARTDGVSASGWQTVTGDVERITQVVGQLLENAIKFSAADGTIRVGIQAADRPRRDVVDRDAGRSVTRVPNVPQGAFVALSVEDDGVGIAPAALPGIFRTFAQVDQSSTRRSDGFGLGLPVARQLAELHGGELLAQSDGESRGARFTLTLPALGDCRAPAPQVAAPGAVFASLAGVSVMVIDDQEEVRESLAAVLEQSGAEVLAAESGRDAIAQLEARGPQREPDILICDIAMPDEDGYVTLLRIREWEATRGVEPQERLAAIAVTAFAQREDRDRALSRGYALHFSKPVDPARLLVAVAALAGK